jgi:hypothetical protein
VTVDEALRIVYTNGLCTVLACAFMAADPVRFDLVETDESNWHVAVEDPDGRFWDVEGCHEPDEFEARWGEATLLADDPDIDRMIGEGDWRGLADYLTAPDPALGLDAVTDNVWAVTCGLAAEILAR